MTLNCYRLGLSLTRNQSRRHDFNPRRVTLPLVARHSRTGGPGSLPSRDRRCSDCQFLLPAYRLLWRRMSRGSMPQNAIRTSAQAAIPSNARISSSTIESTSPCTIRMHLGEKLSSLFCWQLRPQKEKGPGLVGSIPLPDPPTNLCPAGPLSYVLRSPTVSEART